MLAKTITPYPKTPYFNSNNIKLSNWNSLITHANYENQKTKLKRKTSSVHVAAAYTRKSLEAPGAYELRDDETGQKVIVWGGADDPPPDFDVFSKLNSGNQKIKAADGIELTPEVTKNLRPKARVGKSAGGFGRLKVQKVKALVNRASKMKQETHEHDELEEHTQSGVKSTNNGNMGKISNGDIYEVKGTEYIDLDESDGSEFHSEQETDPNEYDKSMPRRKGSQVPSMRGWGGGGPVPSSESEPKDFLKQRNKVSFDKDFFSRKAFRDLGCNEYLINALKAQQYIRPSHIQAMSYTSVLEGQSCIIADQSGAGKTLAYLAPLVQRLRQEELQGLSKSSSQSPRAVILVPTAELASQVLGNCRSMSKYGVPLRSMVVTGGFKQKTQLENLKGGIDILIATPGRFIYLIKEGFLQLSSLRCAVLDEVDILFDDEDFEMALESLINSSPVTTQYLFVTATLPVDIYNKLVQVFPDCKVITGPSMHRTSPGLEEVLVDCSGEDGSEKSPDTAFQNKKTALLQLADKSPVHKTIVFCNKIETCRKVENALKRIDRKGAHVRVLPFHAALTQEARLANMKEFTTSRSGKGSLFLVCTDRASRGIDFSGVEHVILFDFPRDPSEYVRRVGRTARGAGGKGKAYIFVVGKQVSLARKIIDRNQKGHPLHDVPGAYELFQ